MGNPENLRSFQIKPILNSNWTLSPINSSSLGLFYICTSLRTDKSIPELLKFNCDKLQYHNSIITTLTLISSIQSMVLIISWKTRWSFMDFSRRDLLFFNLSNSCSHSWRMRSFLQTCWRNKSRKSSPTQQFFDGTVKSFKTFNNHLETWGSLHITSIQTQGISYMTF